MQLNMNCCGKPFNCQFKGNNLQERVSWRSRKTASGALELLYWVWWLIGLCFGLIPGLPLRFFKKEEKRRIQTHTVSTKKAWSKMGGSCSLGEFCCYWCLRDTCWVLTEEKRSPKGLQSHPWSALEPDVAFPTHNKCEISAWSPSLGLWGERVHT